MLTGKGNLFDFYLGHRYSQDWSRSSDIKLYETNEKKKAIELGCWSSSPSLVDVVKALDKWFPTSGKLERCLKQEKIQLVYSRPGGTECLPLQKYIHGCVKKPKGTYFKVEQKWFVFSSSLYQVLDRNFSFLSNLLLKQEAITNIIKYPWHSKTMEIVESDSTIKTVLGLDKTFPDDKLKEIFEILTDEFDLFDDTGNALFTKHSCLFPMTSKLCSKSGKVSNNNSTPGSSNSLDQSILTPVESSDGTVSLVPKGRTNEKKRNKIRLKLLDIFEKKLKDTKGLLTKIAMLSKNETHYVVENAVVTTELLSKINVIEPSLKDTDIFNFLKSFSNLNENEYNELYLFASAPDGYFVLPGDRIEPNKVELFDLLVHDSEKRVSYLFQVKKGLDYHTRDACAQIRNSAELLWHDFMRGHKRHIELFWENVVESKTATSAYRHFVREKLMTLKKEEFVRMFDDDVQLVFVLAFSTKSAKNNQFLKWDFQLITSEMLYKLDSKFDSTVHSALKEKDILTELGYLADSFIGMTQSIFINVCSNDPRPIKLSIKRKKELYRILRDHGTCDLSTIAKLELLTLDNCFNKFQIGGSGRRFKLQICHIDSC
ncbi:Hypothetical predicted protein [Mytilus galloprovincialis]|uniref:Uncharacterized protein n=1 Tax=Mytilus galloprovincialis TaxID=29158 RepID=A0A8B6BFA5_MYTGA|nr:Hypothetical predicted protein [Mytilus galloprovincialis]